MGFDPKVLESIREYKISARRERRSLVTPFVLAVLLGMALLLFTVLARGWISDVFRIPAGGEQYIQQRAVLFMKWIAGLLAILLVSGFGYNLYAAVRYAQARFELFISDRQLEWEPTELDKFVEAIEGAAIGAGVAAPALVVLDDPAANALAFESADGTQGVGVTAGLLKADVSVSEVNGIIAHELSHLVIGENIREPALTDVEFQPSLFMLVFGILVVTSILVVPASVSYMVIEILFAAAILAALMLIHRSEMFMMKMLDLSYQHNDMLADSLAVMITRDPAALKSAVTKLDAMARQSGRVPGGTILSQHLFVTPPTASGDYFRYATNVAGEILSGRKKKRTWLLFDRQANEAEHKLLEMESRMTQERLLNLDLIEQGRWRALEDWTRE
jgi:Zn-dependent protease with chaperone function